MNAASRVIVLTTLLMGCNAAPQSPAPEATTMPSVSVEDLNHGLPVIGWLGKPLGSIVTISGRAVREGERNDYWSVNMAHNLFAVETVEGLPLKTDIEIYLPRDIPFPKERAVSFIGYESGGFINPPPEASKYEPELKWYQTNGRHFQTEFHALKVLP